MRKPNRRFRSGSARAAASPAVEEIEARAARLGIQLSGTQSLRTIIGEPPPDADPNAEPDEQLVSDHASGKTMKAPTKKPAPKPTPPKPAKP